MKQRIFISSVQKEFVTERQALKEYILNNALLARCRKAGLPEPEFALTDGFVVTIRRKPQLAFETVSGRSEAPGMDQVGTKSGPGRNAS